MVVYHGREKWLTELVTFPSAYFSRGTYVPLSFGMTCLLSWLAMQVPLGLTVAYVLFKAGRRGDPSENEVDAKRDESGTLAPTVMNADAA